MDDIERYARFLCCCIPGIGTIHFKKIAENITSFNDFFNNGRYKSSGILSRKQKESANQLLNSDLLTSLEKNLYKYQVNICCYGEDMYPEFLKDIPDSPSILFSKGSFNPSIFTRTIGVVGSRKHTSYGASVTKYFIQQLVKVGYTIISGMASGIDALAHKYALESGGNTIAILGGGVEEASPKSNEKLYNEIVSKGLVISEYPPKTEIHPSFFVERNRIIAGLSQGVIVIEAGEKSGALITARFGLEYGKEVFAIPGSIYSSQSKGTNNLIKNAEAESISTIDDVLEELEGTLRNAEKISLPEPESILEQELFKILIDTPKTVDTLMNSLKRNSSEVISTLTKLEIEGKVTKDWNGFYHLKE